MSYAKRHYKPNSCIIFDGYPDDEALTTKSVERSRRKLASIGSEIHFDINTKITMNQKQFLSNEKNKIRLIQMLCTPLNSSGFRTKIAFEDADFLIVNSAIEHARIENQTTVVIVGEDIDLLVILNQHAQDYNNIYFFKAGKGRESNKYYTCNSFKHKELQSIVGFLHVFSGCDTTSSLYKQGKHKLINSLEATKLQELAKIFYKNDATKDQIARNACTLIRNLYSSKAEKNLIQKSNHFSLNDLHYLHYTKAKVKPNFAFETLPPSEGAAKEHAFRTYYQLQLWLGNINLNPTQWGWKVVNNQLVPIESQDPPMPENLLKQISCGCKTGCNTNLCTCRKHGLECSDLCANCSDAACSNITIKTFNNEDEIEENDLDSMVECSELDVIFENECDEYEVPHKKRKM